MRTGELDLEVIFSTFMRRCRIDRAAVISRLDEDSLLITVPRYFSEIGIDTIMPSEILNSKLFIQGFYHLIRLLPRICNSLSLRVVFESKSGVQRFEATVVHVVDLSENQEIREVERKICHSLRPIFTSFFRKFNRCGIFSSPVVQIIEKFGRHQLIINQGTEMFEICKDDTRLGGGGDCCAICLNELSTGNEAWWRTPCLHLYHPQCLSRWLETAASCPLCRFDLPAGHQIWMFECFLSYPN